MLSRHWHAMTIVPLVLLAIHSSIDTATASEFLIDTANGTPKVAFDGERYLVVSGSRSASFVLTNGTVPEPGGVVLSGGTFPQFPFFGPLASNGQGYLTAYSGSFFSYCSLVTI